MRFADAIYDPCPRLGQAQSLWRPSSGHPLSPARHARHRPAVPVAADERVSGRDGAPGWLRSARGCLLSPPWHGNCESHHCATSQQRCSGGPLHKNQRSRVVVPVSIANHRDQLFCKLPSFCTSLRGQAGSVTCPGERRRAFRTANAGIGEARRSPRPARPLSLSAADGRRADPPKSGTPQPTAATTNDTIYAYIYIYIYICTSIYTCTHVYHIMVTDIICNNKHLS